MKPEYLFLVPLAIVAWHAVDVIVRSFVRGWKRAAERDRQSSDPACIMAREHPVLSSVAAPLMYVFRAVDFILPFFALEDRWTLWCCRKLGLKFDDV